MRVERLITSNPELSEKLKAYAEWLLNLGDGKLPTIFKDIIEVPEQMVCRDTAELEDKVYDNFQENMENVSYLYG